MKPANLVHVAGFCISCGIVAYYTIPSRLPEITLAESSTSRFSLPGLDDEYRIWGAALAYDQQGRNGDALGCYERYLTLSPDGPNAAEARQRITALRKKGTVAEPVPRADHPL